jgi:transposase
LYADGLQVSEIAYGLRAHPNTIYADLHAFDQLGLSQYLQPLAHSGAPPRGTLAQREEIWRLADQVILACPMGAGL